MTNKQLKKRIDKIYEDSHPFMQGHAKELCQVCGEFWEDHVVKEKIFKLCKEYHNEKNR